MSRYKGLYMKHKTSEMLNMLHQEHIVAHLKSLSHDDQLKMVSHIDSLDFSVLNESDTEEERGKFEPLYATTLDDIASKCELFTEIGLEAIRAGKVGAVLLAGGQGSRLGFEHPKGMYKIGVNRDLYIFECLINNLLEVTKQAGAWVPLFIMTSVDNNRETREFFEEHNYFGYS